MSKKRLSYTGLSKSPLKAVLTWRMYPDLPSPASPGGKYSGGNSYQPQPTPCWQKPLTSFFVPGLWVNGKVGTDDAILDASKRPPVMGMEEEGKENDEPEEVGTRGEKKKGEEEKKPEKNGMISDSDED